MWHSMAGSWKSLPVTGRRAEDEPLPDTGTITGGLKTWASIIAADISRPERIVYLRAMASARGYVVDVCPLLGPAHPSGRADDRARQGPRRAHPTARQVVDHIIAPLYHHAIFGLAVGSEYSDALVADVFAMCR